MMLYQRERDALIWAAGANGINRRETGGTEKEEQKVTEGQAESVPNGCGDDSWCRGDSAANWFLIPAGEEVVCPLTTQSGRRRVSHPDLFSR